MDEGLSRLSTIENIRESREYLNSPYVTAGNRVYVGGNQDDTFPD